MAGRLRGSIERGDPWPGFALGLLVALLISIAFAADFGPATRADLAALDLALAWREPVRADPGLLLVEIDENSVRANPQVKSRGQYALALRTLHRLGARLVAFDVEFIAWTEKTGYRPDGTFFDESSATQALANAMRRHGNVLIGVHPDPNPLWARHEDGIRRLAGVLEKEPRGNVPDLVGKAGLSGPGREAILSSPAEARALALWVLVDRTLRERPRLKLEEFLSEAGDTSKERIDAFLAVHTALAMERGGSLPVHRPPALIPRDYPFPVAINHLVADASNGLGSTVTLSQDQDGILRRIPTLVQIGNRVHPYLGTLLGIRTLEAGGAKVSVEARESDLEIRIEEPGKPVRILQQPLLRDATTLANWAGRPGEWSARGEEFYARLPIQRLVELGRARWDVVYRGGADLCAQLLAAYEKDGAAPPPLVASFAAAYKDWSDLAVSEAPDPGVLALAETGLESLATALARELPALLEQARAHAGGMTPRVVRQRDDIGRAIREQLAELAVAEARLRPLVEGRSCLIGNTDKFGGDLHATAMGVGQPGVELHMTAANMILAGKFLRHAPAWLPPLLVLLAGGLAAAAAAYLGTLRSAGAAILLVGLAAGGYLLAFSKAGLVLSAAGPPAAILLSFATSVTYRQLVTLRSQRRLRKELEAKMSPQVVAAYLENPEAFSRPRRIVATVFFSDVKGFTSISEGMDPERLVGFVNRYLDRMTRVHIECHGFIDKYIGDGIMAVYGAPIEDPRHALRAAGAALANLKALGELNAELRQEGLPELRIRVGLNTGELVAARIGSRDRGDLTMMGDTVNLASRLEGANKAFGSSIMVSEHTRSLVEDQFQFRELDTIKVVGKKRAVKVFELLASKGQPSPLPAGFLEAWNAGLAAYKVRDWVEASRRFHEAEALRKGDDGCLLYIDRIIRHQMQEPPADWEPVHALDVK